MSGRRQEIEARAKATLHGPGRAEHETGGWRLAARHADDARFLLAELAEANRKLAETREALKRAAYVAEHLMQMIDRETWRAHGGDDGQGHYEGDYHEAQIALEVKEWAALAVADEATT